MDRPAANATPLRAPVAQNHLNGLKGPFFVLIPGVQPQSAESTENIRPGIPPVENKCHMKNE